MGSPIGLQIPTPNPQPHERSELMTTVLVADDEKNIVTFHRVPYDIEGAQKKILSAGLPERLAIRLAEGS